jgi:hypothetical protein
LTHQNISFFSIPYQFPRTIDGGTHSKSVGVRTEKNQLLPAVRWMVDDLF